MIRRPAALDSFASLGASVAGFVFGIPTSILLARAVGPAGKGVITLTQTIVAQGIIFSLGVEVALIHAAGKRDEDVRKLAGSALRVACVVGPLAGMAGVTFLLFGSEDVPAGPIRHWMFLSMAAVPLLLAGGYLNSLLVATGRIAEVAGLGAGRTLLTFLAAILAILLDWGAAGFLALNLAAVAVIALMTGAFAIRAGVLPPRRAPGERTGRKLIAYGLRGHLGTVLQGLNNRLDVFVISAVLTPSALGLYSVAVTAAETLLLVPTFVGNLILQRAASDPSQEATRFTSLATRMTSMALFGGAAILALVGEPLIRILFGAAFAGASTSLLWLLPGVWALGLWRNITNHLMARGAPIHRTTSAAAATVVTIVLDLMLVPTLGIKGAALASSVAYTTAFLVALVPYLRLTGESWSEVVIPRRSDLSSARASIRLAVSYVREGRGRAIKPDTFYDTVE